MSIASDAAQGSFADDSIADLWLERCRRHQVYTVPYEFPKLPLEADKFEKANRAIELHEPIDVAVTSALISCDGSE